MLRKKEIEFEYDNTFSCNGEEFMVLTDEESDDMWDEQMDNYIDDCILDQMPTNLRSYFDYERFKKDESYSGRGALLSGYDGIENEVEVNGDDYYIYRIG